MSLPRTRSLTATLIAGAAVLLLAACANSTPGPTPTSTSAPDKSSGDLATGIVGPWGVNAAGEPHLEFTEAGEVRGSDGCNGIVSNYTIEDETVEIAQFASTLKACQGVDDWLRGVRAVQLDGETLIILDSSGKQIGELARGE